VHRPLPQHLILVYDRVSSVAVLLPLSTPTGGVTDRVPEAHRVSVPYIEAQFEEAR
jgi:hypothetical protein